MEEVAVQVDDIDKQRDEKSISPGNHKDNDISGDPKICPQVGKKHQAEIPPLMSESDYYCSQKNNKFGVGLPIPVIWIKDEEALVNVRKVGVSGNSNVQQETEIGVLEKNKCKCLVPGSSIDTWNEIEEASLTLGLYIFGKSPVQLKRFIGNKTMGDILTFYYGNFPESDNHRRWSEYKKMNKNNGVYEQKIFTRPRQQELLSRLLPNMPEECCSKLFKVSMTFVKGKMLLEDYVSTLKAIVGLSALVEAVGIGKENDLTADSVKSTHAVPVGKDCSKLTYAEIMNILTGDFRLSKSQSSNLFWEAVWPRLLGRGWHSEQPGSKNSTGSSKIPVFFIVPGVENFSKQLVKGNHYFDSISDVLAKVASDPELIVLEKAQNNSTKETKWESEDSPEQQHHCYDLRPQTQDFSTDGMMFTIVDTSPGNEKLTELKGLPVGVIQENKRRRLTTGSHVERNFEFTPIDDPNVDIVPTPLNHCEDQPDQRESTARSPETTIKALEALADVLHNETKDVRKRKGYLQRTLK